ncbi:MAG: class I SAM-dependent methyltransferase [Gammaproteobacteria bacterium]
MTPFEAAWKRRFEKFAAARTDAAIAGWSETGLETRVRYFLQFWSRPAYGRWLDVGCGAGTYSQILAKYHLDTIGVDYSVPTLIKAKTRYSKGIEWGAANVYQLPFKAQSFDGVLCFGVLQAISDEITALHELRRVSKEKSEVWVDGLNKWCIIHWRHLLAEKFSKRTSHLHYLSPFSLTRDLSGATTYWLPILPRRLSFLQRLFYQPMVLRLWQRLSWLTRFLSHSFLIRIDSGYV